MKHSGYKNLIQVIAKDGVLLPGNDEAQKIIHLNNNKEIFLKPQTPRDLMLHKCYHVFCSWLWQKMPLIFKTSRCPNKNDMYKYLKVISGQYEVGMIYKGKTFYNFESISFGRMSNEKFKLYLEDQMMLIYSEMLVPLKMEELFEEMNKEFKKIFNELI